MPKRIQQEKANVKHETEEVTDDVVPPPPDTKKAQELKSEMDDILDEIDSVLEKNAEEFVKAYVQKGGQFWDAKAASATRREHGCPRFRWPVTF